LQQFDTAFGSTPATSNTKKTVESRAAVIN
jgi:hypothetical protein